MTKFVRQNLIVILVSVLALIPLVTLIKYEFIVQGAQFSVCFAAFLHLLFFVLEIFFWTKPIGLKVFSMKKEQALQSAKLAMNQGFYNGFVAIGIMWFFWSSDFVMGYKITSLFLVFGILAGIFGAATVSWKIFFVQALPCLSALLLINASLIAGR